MDGKEVEAVYLNGEFLPLEDASIPLDDRAVLYGDGLFETIRGYRGKPFRLERHLKRLEEGCRTLGKRNPLTSEEAGDALRRLLELNSLEKRDSYIRITLTGGPSGGGKRLEPGSPVGVFMLARPYTGHSPHHYREGISIIISKIARDPASPLSYVKSTNYLGSLIAKQEAFEEGADDAVLLTTSGNIAEATSSNIFLVMDGELHTPENGCGLLPGITREAVVELGSALGVETRQSVIGPTSLFACDEIFLTNSMVELMPVREVSGKEIGNGCPGPVTMELSRAYRDLVQSELGLEGGINGKE